MSSALRRILVQTVIADIFALICGITGWFYLLYSRGAAVLAPLETSRLNARRTRLRRVGGAAMVLLAAMFFCGSNINADLRPGTFVLVWISVMILLIVVVSLALVDIRLTARLRESLQKRN